MHHHNAVTIPPTISHILALHRAKGSANNSPQTTACEIAGDSLARRQQQQLWAEREWSGAIAAINTLLQDTLVHVGVSLAYPMGLVVSSNAPVITDLPLAQRLSAWVVQTSPQHVHPRSFPQLPPVGQALASPPLEILSLPVDEGWASEQFCLIMTDAFCLVLALGYSPQGMIEFQFSFDPIALKDAYQALRWQLSATAADNLPKLDALVEHFPSTPPDYHLVTQFSHLLLRHLPDTTAAAHTSAHWKQQAHTSSGKLPRMSYAQSSCEDAELLQAIAHEVRTPLTTIRTLARLALKQKNLSKATMECLQAIDRECTAQIDRFGLIFQAVELETMPSKSSLMPLAPTSLDQVLRQSIPRWQQEAQRSSLTLEVVLPQRMPQVVSNPALLDQVLTSLVERFAQRLPNGSNIRVIATLAGSQLKLQLESDVSCTAESGSATPVKSALKSIGNLLMFQPETGNLSLNLAVTKNLFHALGGKLIVRQRPDQGEVLIMFLPLDMGSPDVYEI